MFRGYSEELVCEAEGYPIPKIQWHYNPESHVNVSKGKLTVSEPGIYNCTASNDVGSASHVVEVILKGNTLLTHRFFTLCTFSVHFYMYVFLDELNAKQSEGSTAVSQDNKNIRLP